MQATMATTKLDKGPIPNYSPGYALYYISFVVVFSFFFLNIFVALIILTFQQEGEREIASCELDRNQVKNQKLSILTLARICLMFAGALICMYVPLTRTICLLFLKSYAWAEIYKLCRKKSREKRDRSLSYIISQFLYGMSARRPL